VGRRANQIPAVSIEQVLAWNSQMIVTIDRDFD
jgi:ABC-type Fe3+-hydroxamate transport system substrate-binding protein